MRMRIDKRAKTVNRSFSEIATCLPFSFRNSDGRGGTVTPAFPSLHVPFRPISFLVRRIRIYFSHLLLFPLAPGRLSSPCIHTHTIPVHVHVHVTSYKPCIKEI